jgi:two-component system, OmpR family, response regulator
MTDPANRILIVDDKPDIVETVSFCFVQEGFAISTAFDGRQALEVARRDQPDLIVLDVMLPGENGYQVARFLREDWQEGKLHKKPRILLLTARTVFDAQREEFLQTWSGADGFMYKPFDLDELVSRVRAMLHANGRDEPAFAS